MLSFITGALGFLGRIPAGALNLIDRRRKWATADRVEIDDSFTAEIASLREELAEAEGDDERVSLKEAIKRARQEQRSFHRARRELLLSKSLVQRMTPKDAFMLGGPELPHPEREVLANAAFVVARLEPPTTFEQFYRQGSAFFAAGDFQRALEQYNRALALKSNHAGVLDRRGNTLQRLGRHEKALADHNRAVELNPDDPVYLNNRGTALQALERYEEALADYSRALVPGLATPVYNSAAALSLMDRPVEALEQLKEAIYRHEKFRAAARENDNFDNLRSNPTLGPEFERLVAEPED